MAQSSSSKTTMQSWSADKKKGRGSVTMDAMLQKDGIKGMDKMTGGQRKAADQMLLAADDLHNVLEKVNKDSKGRGVAGLYMPGGFRMEVPGKDEVKMAAEGGPISADAKERLKTGLAVKKYMDDQHRKNENNVKRERELVKKRGKQEGGFNKRWDLELEVADPEKKSRVKSLLDKMNEEENIEMTNTFNGFDLNKDKSFGSIELAEILTMQGVKCSVEDAANMLYFCGVEHVDEVKYEDFILMLPKVRAFRRKLEKDAREAFWLADKNGNGTLGYRELKDALLAFGGPGTSDEADLQRMIKEADPQRIGEIDYTSYCKMLFGTKPVLTYPPETTPEGRKFKQKMQKLELEEARKKGGGGLLGFLGRLCSRTKGVSKEEERRSSISKRKKKKKDSIDFHRAGPEKKGISALIYGGDDDSDEEGSNRA